MGMVATEITLKNVGDEIRVRHGKIREIRQMTVTALVDTGAIGLVINEDARIKLGLDIEKTNKTTLADGSFVDYGVTEAIKVCWKNRDAVTRAVVLPKAKNILLGALPLEEMDLMVHPQKQEVVGVHGEEELYGIYTLLR
ncbi:MAG: hypothetical protein Ta2G_16510 [Termitinemataceae bacterium]|nr:MAG: hypothetical protein Ta2G_16510 [Termitinemataceae bacterium]